MSAAPVRASLETYGWDAFFASAFGALGEDGLTPARVCAEHRGLYRLRAEAGEMEADAAGRLRHRASARADLPAVGDWVAVRPSLREEKATIEAVLPRKSRFVRKAAGTGAEAQVVAANVDTVFLVTGLDRDYNLRRIERYLVMAWESSARPVILLNKADLRADAEEALREVKGVAPGVPLHALSARSGHGLEALVPYLGRGRTVAFLGSSGVGKSTIINRLLGSDVQRTGEVRPSDQHGRHVTSHRQLLVLPGGGLVIDTPGMRELQLWDAATGLQDAFEDIQELAQSCRYRNCRHRQEPGCAVTAALGERLSAERLQSYRKLSRELEKGERQQEAWARQAARQKVKSIHRLGRSHKPRA